MSLTRKSDPLLNAIQSNSTWKSNSIFLNRIQADYQLHGLAIGFSSKAADIKQGKNSP